MTDESNKNAIIYPYRVLLDKFRREYDELVNAEKKFTPELAAKIRRLKRIINKLHAWGLTDLRKNGKVVF
jgi:hypothetical protein